jgi:hypothetical protein
MTGTERIDHLKDIAAWLIDSAEEDPRISTAIEEMLCGQRAAPISWTEDEIKEYLIQWDIPKNYCNFTYEQREMHQNFEEGWERSDH